MNSTVAEPRESVSSQPSIVTHPWFPKVIGLWFAALFGLSSLAVASAVLESVVTTLGIDRFVPAAAPPLGQTARLLLAMAMAGLGEIVGLVIGGRLAASRRPQPVRQRQRQRGGEPAECVDTIPHVRGRDRHADAPPRKPLSAIDELTGIDHALRRRALASEADHEPRPFFEVAPVPGADCSPAAHADSETESIVPAEDAQAADPVAGETLDLTIYDPPVEQSAMAEPAPFAAPVEAPSEAVAPRCQTPGIASASLDALGVVHLSERLALALQARRERRAQQLSSAAVVAPVESVANAISPPEQTLAPAAAMARLPGLYTPFAEAIDDDEPHDIPALARSLGLPATLADLPEAPADEPEEIAPELPRGLEILARRAPKASGKADSIASMAFEMAPVAAAGDEVAAIAAEGDEPDEAADETAESGYSSLLAMGSSFARPEPVRIEEPQSDEIEPVVIFPGQGARARGQFSGPFATPFGQPGPAPAADFVAPAASQASAATGTTPPADSEETGRALRAALASLQRISGAR